MRSRTAPMAPLAFGLLLALLLGAATAQADWVRNGSAYLSGGYIAITPASANQAGSAWLDNRVDLAYDFDITLQVYLGGNDVNGADGLSILFHNDPSGTATVGDTAGGGEWVGMHTIYPALSVEIDTYQNSGWGDPANDHIGVNEFRNAAAGPNHAGAAPVSLGNVEDGADHLLRLVWNSATTTLTVWFDGTQRITYTNDIAANIFGGSSQVWFGVAGSTGGSYNLQQFRPLIVNTLMSVAKSVTPAAVDPGAVVAYTVTIQNNSGIPSSVSRIVDPLPAGFTYQAGTATGLTTSDPTVSGQTLTWSGNWLVAPGQTRTLAFQATSTTVPGVYTNSVTLSGTDFSDLTTGPTAAVTVADSTIPATGNKPLYFYDDYTLSRTPPAAQSEITLNGGQSATWTLTPPLAAPLTITNAIAIDLWIRGGSNRRFTLTVSSSTAGVIGTLGPFTISATTYGANPSAYSISISGNLTLPAGSTLQATINNVSATSSRRIYVHPYWNGIHSRLTLEALTVIHVDQVAFFNAAYPGGTPMTSSAPGRPVFIRATVSDPFGSFDIAGADLLWTGPLGSTSIVMDPVGSSAATKFFEYATTLPSSGAEGIWTARVTAEEGTEGLVRHAGVATLRVAAPNILLLKSVSTVSDPINGATHPKAIPGAFMQYTITATNQGGGTVDADTVVVVDPVPANTALFVGDLGAPGSGPVAFSNGAIPSGLTYTFGGLGNGADDIAFSNNGSGSWSYTPVADANGVDSAVTHVRIAPKGMFNGTSAGSIPAFTLGLRVRVR
ncbi:MAG: hypothetical protein WAU91_23445 [Desulfatitalea sp.]